MSGGLFDMAFDVEGLKNLKFDWTATQRNIARQLVPIILFALKEEAPVSERPDKQGGRFRDSIGFRIETTSDRMLLQFVSTAPYAQYILDGTRGGSPIYPTKTKAMRWAVPGGYQFASVIPTRGSTAANHFNKRVADQLAPHIYLSFSKAIVVIST